MQRISNLLLTSLVMTFVLCSCGGDSDSHSDITVLAGSGSVNTHSTLSIGRISASDPELKVTIPLRNGNSSHKVCFENVTDGNHKVTLTMSDGSHQILSKEGDCVTDSQDFSVSIAHDGEGLDVPVFITETSEAVEKSSLRATTIVPGTQITAGGCTNCKISGVSANGLNVSHGVFTNSTFTEVEFKGSNFEGSKFTKCNFQDSSFMSSTFDFSTFLTSQLKNVSFAGAYFSNVSLIASFGQNLDFRNATLVGTGLNVEFFFEANLAGALVSEGGGVVQCGTSDCSIATAK